MTGTEIATRSGRSEQDQSPIDLNSLLHPSLGEMTKLVLIGATQAVSIVATVLILRRLIDSLTIGAPVSETLPLAYFYLAVGAVLGVTRGVEYAVAEGIGYRLVARLRMTLFGHLLDLPARAVKRSSQGAVLLRFTGDLSTYRTWISRGLSRGIVSSLIVIGGLAVLFLIDWVIGLAVIMFLFFGAAGSAVWGYQVKRTTRGVRWRRSLLTSNVAEQISSVAVVQTFGRSVGETGRLGTQNEDLLQSLLRAAKARAALRFISSTAGSLAVGAVLVVGVLQLARQQVTIGDVVAAMTAARFLTGPMRTLGRSHEYWQAAQVSKRKLSDFLSRSKRGGAARENLETLRPRRGSLEVSGISVPGALDNVSLKVDGGELVAIVGENGAGKSTLLSVIARQVDPSEGQVVIDDQVLSECSLVSVARNIGMMGPDLPLMRGTLLRNISYRYGKASEDLVQDVMVSCGIDDIADSLEGGLSSWIVEGGSNLPMGHRQRIMLARATMGRPRLLLLDEPTSNLDPRSKEDFRRIVSRYRGTILFVTQDPDEASLADRVFVLEKGRIVREMTGERYRSEAGELRRRELGLSAW